MEKDKTVIEQDETPTMKKIRALVNQVATGTIAFETVIPQAIISIIVLGTAAFVTIQGHPLPEWLSIAAGAIIGFYFGSDYEFRKITGKAKNHGAR